MPDFFNIVQLPMEKVHLPIYFSFNICYACIDRLLHRKNLFAACGEVGKDRLQIEFRIDQSKVEK